jgi:hypothetical protein
LQRWEPTAGNRSDLALDDTGVSRSSTSTWDQFETNERLYGVRSDFNEDDYTIPIDRSDPSYRERAAKADRIAREIESGQTNNAHVAEERGHSAVDDSGLDEEDKYSGVIRGQGENQPKLSSTNKYTPPARRSQMSQPPLNASHVDPAILSSQLARTKHPEAAAVSTTVAETRASTSENPKGSVSKRDPDALTSSSTTVTVPFKAAIPAASIAPAILAVPAVVTVATNTTASAATPASNTTSTANSTTASNQRVPTVPSNAPAQSSGIDNGGNDLRDSVKLFVNQERLRVDQRRRNMVKQEKEIKKNDLLKFAKSFKLHTPVPRDLIPILTKDKAKQDEIIERSRRNEVEAEARHGKVSTTEADSNNPRSSATTTSSKTVTPTAAIASGVADRSLPNAGRMSFTAASNSGQPRVDRSGLNQANSVVPGRGLGYRLANPQAKLGPGHGQVPSPIPVQDMHNVPTGPSRYHSDTGFSKSSVNSPSSSAPLRFNAKALEFKPNPSAAAFTPSGGPTSAASSPRSSSFVAGAARAHTPLHFFGSRRPPAVSERPSLSNFFNPIKRARVEYERLTDEEKSQQRSVIKPAFTTPPVWDTKPENENKSYRDVFDSSSLPLGSVVQPHQGQLPGQVHAFPLQQGYAAIPGQLNPQQHGGHHQSHHHHPGPSIPQFDDHRMHPSMSSNGSVLASPHLQNANLAGYQSPMGQPVHMMYANQMPQYAMGPGMPQMTPFRQYPGGPYMHQPGQLGGPVMSHGPNGQYIGIPQSMNGPMGQHLPIYSPSQMQAYPQHGGPPSGPNVANGYPSPGRGAAMMMSQGSQQGNPQQMMMGMNMGHQGQAMYASSQAGQG